MNMLKALGIKVLPWAVPAVALLMLGLVLVPINFWHRPANDAVYQGFDPSLVYINKRGGAPAEGVVQVSRDSLKLTAMPNSNPSVHLVTSTMDYKVAMDVRILEGQEGTTPLHIKVWSPRVQIALSLIFGPAPQYQVVASAVQGQTVIKQEVLGTYSPGQSYHLEISLEREKGLAVIQFQAAETSPSGHKWLSLVGGPEDPDYREIVSEPIPVEGGEAYVFGGMVKSVSGGGWYKVTLVWLDSQKQMVGFANDWRPPKELSGWTQKEFEATAPPNAAFARLVLGAGSGRSRYFMTDLFIKKKSSPEVNLLPNGDFLKGAEGWLAVAPGWVFLGPVQESQIGTPSLETFRASLSKQEAQDLFLPLPVALTVSSSSTGGLATAMMENYTVALPSQKWSAMAVNDPRVKRLSVGLIAGGAILFITATALWARRKMAHVFGMLIDIARRPMVISLWPLPLGVSVAVIVFLVFNALLFRLGYHPQDLVTTEILAYVGTRYGITHMYHLPAITTPADGWGGAPFGEAVNPYGVSMAYILTGIGWIYRLFLAEPGNLDLVNFQLGILIKTFNVLFALGDAVLVYLILRQFGMSHQKSLLASTLFLFNPAIWFAMSIFGQTHTISVFFVLLSIWLFEKRCSTGAWFALALAALNRPQLLAPTFLLGLLYLRKFSLRENLYSVSWSVIATFLLLTPFTLALSPSLPVDVWLHNFRVQNPSNPEVGKYFPGSIDAFNIWPIISRFTEGFSGQQRFWFPSTMHLVGPFTYSEMANVLTFGMLLLIAVFLVAKHRLILLEGRYIIFIALGILAFLLLRTGTASPHFILALPLVFLSWRSLSNFVYLSVTTILTATTLISVYGGFSLAIWAMKDFMPAIHYENNAVTQLFRSLMFSDWFITLVSYANMVVFFWLGWEALRALFGKRAGKAVSQPQEGPSTVSLAPPTTPPTKGSTPTSSTSPTGDAGNDPTNSSQNSLNQ